MFLKVLLHVLSYELVTNKMQIEFHNMHDSENNYKFELSNIPFIRAGSLFLPFLFVNFELTPFLIALALIRIKKTTGFP